MYQNKKSQGEDKSTEKVKLEPQRLPLDWFKAPISSKQSSSIKKKSPKMPERLPPGLIKGTLKKDSVTKKSPVKSKLKLEKLPPGFLKGSDNSIKNVVRSKSTDNEKFQPQKLNGFKKQMKKSLPQPLKRPNNSQSEGTQPKKIKVEEHVVRRKLFKEPAQKRKTKRAACALVNDSSNEIQPLEESKLSLEGRNSFNFKLNVVKNEKSASTSSNEEFLALENATSNDTFSPISKTNSTLTSNVSNEVFCLVSKAKNSSIPKIIQKHCAKIDAINATFNEKVEKLITQNKQELEKIITETNQQLMELKQEFINVVQQNTENKENLTARRSPRLSKTKFSVLSPVSKNLRVSTLKKNLRKEILSSPKSEKVEKAEMMYNNLRINYPILQTPKFKTGGGTSRETPKGQSLSMTLQMQCLMLQDTPLPSRTNNV